MLNKTYVFFIKNIKLIISISLLYFLLRTGALQVSKIQTSLKNPQIILLGLFAFFAQFIIFTQRFNLILSLEKKITFKHVLKLQFIGQFFNIFIPGGVGGDIVKSISLSESDKISKHKTLSLALVDRLFGLYAMILMSLLFLLFHLSNESLYVKNYFYISLVLFLTSTLLLFFRNTFLKLINQLSTRLKMKLVTTLLATTKELILYIDLFIKRKKFLSFFSLCVVAQILSISFLYWTNTLLNEASLMPLTLFFPLACFGFMAMAIPLTPAGIGLGQAAFYIIFKNYSVSLAESSIIGITLMQLLNMFISLPGAYFFSQNKS